MCEYPKPFVDHQNQEPRKLRTLQEVALFRARIYLRQFRLTAAAGDLEAAVKLHGEAIDVPPNKWSEVTPAAIEYLVYLLLRRAERGKLEDLRDAFTYLQHLLSIGIRPADWVSDSGSLAALLSVWAPQLYACVEFPPSPASFPPGT